MSNEVFCHIPNEKQLHNRVDNACAIFQTYQRWVVSYPLSPPLGCKGCHLERTEPCQLHGPQLSFRLTSKVKNNNDTNNNIVKLPNAIESFPNEVGLCISSIPGAGYGVCAKQIIPVGTWIGPYEGELVRPEEVVLGSDASYMWEVDLVLSTIFM